MSIEVEDRLNGFRKAVDSGSAEEICLTSRALRWACDRAQGYVGVWDETKTSVRAQFLRALEALLAVVDRYAETAPEPYERKVARFSFLRVLARYESLFGTDEAVQPFLLRKGALGPLEEVREDLLASQH